MEQLLCHLVGDYWLQNDWMASNKKKDFGAALTHSIIYTLPFVLICHSIWALLVICITHCIIDGTYIVNKLNQIKNWDFKNHQIGYFKQRGLGILGKTSMQLADGYSDRPLFIRIWLIIIQDNILHLVINYLAIKYL